jgi:hypothetical protein
VTDHLGDFSVANFAEHMVACFVESDHLDRVTASIWRSNNSVNFPVDVTGAAPRRSVSGFAPRKNRVST